VTPSVVRGPLGSVVALPFAGRGITAVGAPARWRPAWCSWPAGSPSRQCGSGPP